MEWTVVTVIIALVGLFLTVGKPILNLNNNIVKLNMSLDALRERTERHEKDLVEQKAHSHEAHQRLWEHNDQQDEKLNDHEARIGILEGKKN